jgi:23S rRNA pseudouridine1911/1915/1917 synthase
MLDAVQQTMDQPRLEIEIEILEQTPDYVLVNKPAPMLVHPNKPGNPLTMQDHLERLLAVDLVEPASRRGAGKAERGIYIINRLDRETSGLVLVAITLSRARKFYAAMRERRITKTYQALVWGWPEWQEAECREPIVFQRDHGPTPVYLKRMIHPRGQSARTRFRVLERLSLRTGNGSRFSVIEARPLTGRMHQIRVHLAHLGFPVVGDKIYGPDCRLYVKFIEQGWTPEIAAELLLPRHALHSTGLEILEKPGGTTDSGLSWSAGYDRQITSWIKANRSDSKSE